MDDLAIFVGGDRNAVTLLAMQLEAIMLTDSAARADYERIYGRAWVSLDDIQTTDAEVELAFARITETTTVAR